MLFSLKQEAPASIGGSTFTKDGLVDTYLAESHNGPPRKYYKITEAGRTEYIESVREWSDFTKAVNMLLTEGGEPNE